MSFHGIWYHALWNKKLLETPTFEDALCSSAGATHRGRPGSAAAGGADREGLPCRSLEFKTDVLRLTGGGRLIVVQTNNASYEQPGDSGNGGETAQQLAMSQLRAVEHGRAVVVVATSGVSAMIAPDGTGAGAHLGVHAGPARPQAAVARPPHHRRPGRALAGMDPQPGRAGLSRHGVRATSAQRR